MQSVSRIMRFINNILISIFIKCIINVLVIHDSYFELLAQKSQWLAGYNIHKINYCSSMLTDSLLSFLLILLRPYKFFSPFFTETQPNRASQHTNTPIIFFRYVPSFCLIFSSSINDGAISSIINPKR